MWKDPLSKFLVLDAPMTSSLADEAASPVTFELSGGASYVSNMPTYQGGMYFSSAGGYVRAQGASKLAALWGRRYTVEFAFIPEVVTGTRTLFDAGVASAVNTFRIYASTTTLFYVNATGSSGGIGTIAAGQLYKLSMSVWTDVTPYQSTRTSVSINGVRVNSYTSSLLGNTDSASSQIYLGSRYNGTEAFQGWISDLKIYKQRRNVNSSSSSDASYSTARHTAQPDALPAYLTQCQFVRCVLKYGHVTGVVPEIYRFARALPAKPYGKIEAYFQKPSQAVAAVSCMVRLYDQISGQVFAEKPTDPLTGFVSFTRLDLNRLYMLEAQDPEGLYKNAYMRDIKPDAMA